MSLKKSLSLIFGLCALFNPFILKGETKLEFGNGYRLDFLNWNLAGNINGQSPNIASELTWSYLQIYQVQLNVNSFEEGGYYARASISQGWIFNGKNQDSDYLGDNRTYEYSRSNNYAGKGTVSDASLALGYYAAQAQKLKIIPVAGYSYNIQNLTITNGFSTIPATGPFPGLNSSYQTLWYGPWIGLNIILKSDKKIDLSCAIELHYVDFQAMADWNTRYDLMHPLSFIQKARGYGGKISIEGEYNLSNRWSLRASLGYQNWCAGAGVNRFFFLSGNTIDTRLNGIQWNTGSILLHIIYKI